MYKSTFMGLNTALRGVLAHQAALDTTSHNISNLSTEGYTRQRAEHVAAPAWSYASAFSQTTPGQIGTGVEILRIERLRDSFIDANVRQQFGRQSNSQALVEQLAQVESAFQEPGDNGLRALLNMFWSSMDAVAANPQSMSARQAFVQSANALSDGFNQVAADLQGIAAQSDQRLDQTVTEINGISQRIAQLNAEIKSSIEHGHQPNDLLDERDRLMDDLSKLVNYTWTENSAGEVTISFGTAPNLLVDPTVSGGYNNLTRFQLDAAFAPGGGLTSGRAFADETLFNTTIPTLLSQLDALVDDFATDLNAAHAAGTDLSGNAGGALFVISGPPGPFTATNVRFNGVLMTNPGQIAASNSPVGSPEPGNGRNFANILDTIRPSGQASLGGQTWEAFYSSVITSVGAQTQTANRNMENADILVEMAMGRRDQVSGVSLDEEMSNMLRFQHAYNASARVMTTLDDALDTIINRMGRVGL